VNARPIPENKRMNRTYNHTVGQHVGRAFFSGDAPAANRQIAPRITGDYTGTTQMILRWAACKWGIDQDVVFAQAAVESWWRQTTKGDWETSGCPPGHGPGVDGQPGQCPQSWGILQNRYPYEMSSWPGIARSTAMNADTAYAIWRTCFDGYETWLNTVQHVGTYQKGNMWACVGRWFAGRWRTQPAEQYITKVRQYLRQKIWTTPSFQEG
jgi:autotransporter family porin